MSDDVEILSKDDAIKRFGAIPIVLKYDVWRLGNRKSIEYILELHTQTQSHPFLIDRDELLKFAQDLVSKLSRAALEDQN